MEKENAGIVRVVFATVALAALTTGAAGMQFARTWKADPTSANRSGITLMEETGFYCNVNALTKAERERHKRTHRKAR